MTVRRPIYKLQRKSHKENPAKNKVRNYSFERIDVKDIMPGDIIRLENDETIFFDGVLIKGSCLVDESLLTGETIPVSKVGMSGRQDQIKQENLLFCGSKCLILREKEVLVMVTATNWNTFKGKIVGSLLYSKMPNSIMKKEVLNFIKWCTIGCFIFLIVILTHDYFHDKIHFKRVMTHFVDVLDTGIQPTVIFMFQVTFVVVGAKLADRDIHLLDGDKLFEAGRIHTVCFDKTGTLTESEMKLFGVVLNEPSEGLDIKEGSQDPYLHSISKSAGMSSTSFVGSNNTRRKFQNLTNLYYNANEVEFNKVEERDEVFYAFAAMGCCHDLHKINGKVLGDPIEREMFSFSEFEMSDEVFKDVDEMEAEDQDLFEQQVVNPSYRNLIDREQLKQSVLKNKEMTYSVLLDKLYKNLPKIKPSNRFISEYNLPTNFIFRLIKISPFNSIKKCMSVLVYANDQLFMVTKGAPETVISMSKRDSVPENINHLLMRFGQHGMKPLGLAYKKIDIAKYINMLRVKLPEHFKFFDEMVEKETIGDQPIPGNLMLKYLDHNSLGMLLQSIDLDEEEEEMTFVGQLILRNPLKKNSRKTIRQLQFNLIECKIVTGDNLFTSLNVARFSNCIPMNKDVWVAQHSKTEQKVEWMLFKFGKSSQSLPMSLDMSSKHKLANSLSNFGNISRISPQGKLDDPHRFQASHITQSINVAESRAPGKEDLLSRMDEISNSVIVERRPTSLNELINKDTAERVCIVLDGKSLEILLEESSSDIERNFIFERTKVFARTNPDQKKLIVENIKRIGASEQKTVAFVGDGSNDCKALNKANVGLALGNNEASVSSSMVTGSEDIAKILDVIELGKFSLNNMFEVFVMNNGLSFVEMACYLYLVSNDYYFMNWKYVLETLVFTVYAFFMTFGKSNEYINKFYPPAGIFNSQMVLFLVLQFLLTFLIITFGFLIYRSQPFYKV